MAHNDKGLPKEPSASEVADALAKCVQRSSTRFRWTTVDEWFGVESWLYYRHEIANPHRHAAVRYRHFMDASERVLGPDGIWSAFFDESDTYIDAAHACGWDALK